MLKVDVWQAVVGVPESRQDCCEIALSVPPVSTLPPMWLRNTTGGGVTGDVKSAPTTDSHTVWSVPVLLVASMVPFTTFDELPPGALSLNARVLNVIPPIVMLLFPLPPSAMSRRGTQVTPLLMLYVTTKSAFARCAIKVNPRAESMAAIQVIFLMRMFLPL